LSFFSITASAGVASLAAELEKFMPLPIFQLLLEEEFLLKVLGTEYKKYMSKVKRWLL
jgi:protein-S-isoprenylcysteine O-methyltransferase Ste14